MPCGVSAEAGEISRCLTAAVVAVLAAILTPCGAEARQAPPPTLPAPFRIVFAGAQYGTPLKASASLGLFRSQPNPARHPQIDGFIVEAGAGPGGVRASAGLAGFLEFFGLDLRGVVTRTFSQPRGASARSTYGGVEGGLTIYYVRLSAGVAHRLAGPPGDKATIFSWGAAVLIPFK